MFLFDFILLFVNVLQFSFGIRIVTYSVGFFVVYILLVDAHIYSVTLVFDVHISSISVDVCSFDLNL